MPCAKISDENVKLFGQEAILAYQQKRKPDYNLSSLKEKFKDYIDYNSFNTYIYNFDQQYDNVNTPLLGYGKNCFCIIL